MLISSVLKTIDPGMTCFTRISLPLRKNFSVESTRALLSLQSNEKKLRAQAQSKGRFLIYHNKRLKPLMSMGQPVWKSYEEIKPYINHDLEELRPFVLLSVEQNESISFAASTLSLSDKYVQNDSEHYTDLRASMFTIQDRNEAAIVTKGWSLLKWHKKTRYCGYCGSSELIRSLDGHKIDCTKCSEIFYPPTYPVGIVLITNDKNNKILLVNLHRHPPSLFSCVAGFTDVGETMESCVKREAEEEAGVEIRHIEYVKSQHWPFPTGSLMMGFKAQAVSEHFEIQPDEVKEARWFDIQEICNALDNHSECGFLLPPSGTIARTLIENWIYQVSNK
ncbi:NAD-capped RNA hydrolase NudC [Lepeophtheirus salmonis]|uniref:NAD(+) diphosphatase n=1 Tax=Lepeophtheirus salmonis TaxID=72036 RepID=C1BTK8_LEPSM|nr:NAD-capped RNA hydrolase NudC-like [Lepeophtheirus salmonis]ACO12361.1 Peroxisomal NADH pyrophosphatase NUDT12 [Lepeophtheirus salmonis]